MSAATADGSPAPAQRQGLESNGPGPDGNGRDGRTGSPSRRRRRLLLIGIPVVLVLTAAAVVWWFVFRDDSPPAATADDVRETLEQEGGEDAGGSASDGGASEAGGQPGEAGELGQLTGTWSVDPSIGTPGQPGGTFAGYRIQEEFATVGGATAVGRTADVTGGITVEDGVLIEAAFEVDMTTLQSDDGRRDNRLRSDGLQTDSFPTASFTLTEPLELPDEAASGAEQTYSALGQLELHGVTQEVTIDLTALLEGDTIGVLASAPIVLADYDIEKPSSPAIVSIADEGEFELEVFLTRE